MKKPLIALAVVTVIAAGGLTAYGVQTQRNSDKATKAASQQVVAAPKIKFSSDKKTVSYDGVVGQTALATMQKYTTVTTKSTSYGDMVTGINGKTADESSEYWAFYVNGKLANEGAGTYKAVKGDKIEWKLEAF